MGKLFAILLAVAVSGALLIGGGAWYWWSRYGTEFVDSGKTAILEGEASGRMLDENGCMVRAIERHKADWNRTMASAIRNNLWLGGCLNTSRAQEKFCDNVPPESDMMAAAVWAASACASNGLSDSYCGNLFSNAVKYCSSSRRADKLRSGTVPAPDLKS